jgi:hypothetical protein
MSDRGFLFLFSVFMVVVGVGAVGWLAATGQALSFDGIFLALTALLFALAFGLNAVFMIRRAKAALEKPAPQAAKAAAAKTAAPAAPKEQAV